MRMPSSVVPVNRYVPAAYVSVRCHLTLNPSALMLPPGEESAKQSSVGAAPSSGPVVHHEPVMSPPTGEPVNVVLL